MDKERNERVYSVGEITDRVAHAIESALDEAWIEGEVSNFRPASSGHWYFALKDERAVLQAVMFRQAAAAVPFDPRDGDVVRVFGRIGVYPQRGQYQVVVRAMQRAGTGAILAMLEERKRTLAAEGLFESARKRPLPYLPRRIAIVTSPTGAAIRDMVHVLRRRRARLHVVIMPTTVQGEDAGTSIAEQISRAPLLEAVDVVVVTRGGGSIEDLLPFSDERVVRAIAACPVPVISAVGHETDTTLSDLAADLRAPTPSAAAELVCASGDQVADRILASGRTIVRAYRARLSSARLRVDRFGVEELHYRYRNYVQPWYQRLDDALQAIRTNLERRIDAARSRYEIARERVAASSPYLILERGYALIRDADSGTILTRAGQLASGQHIAVTFADGARLARVEESAPDRDTNTPKMEEPNYGRF